MKPIFTCLMILFSCFGASGVDAQNQSAPPISYGKTKSRTQFMTYDIRTDADKNIYKNSRFFMSLDGKWKFLEINDRKKVDNTFALCDFNDNTWKEIDVPSVWSKSADNRSFIHKFSPVNPQDPQLIVTSPVGLYRRQVKIPYSWLDREIFLNIAGAHSAVKVYVNGNEVGYSLDSKNDAVFNISKFIVNGENAIALEVYKFSMGSYLETENEQNNLGGITGGIYIFSQPKVYIEDFDIKTSFDTTNKNGIMDLEIVVRNSYNGEESATIYYDLMDCKGNILRYNYKDIIIGGNGGTDTVRFQGVIKNVLKWNPKNPTQYSLMLRVKKNDRFTEYIPFKFGFRTIEYKNNTLKINRELISIKDLNYSYNNQLESELVKYISQQKKNGYNTLRLKFPQHRRFYEICDQQGIYVIDAVNLSTNQSDEQTKSGMTFANHPRWLPHFIERSQSVVGRNRNYTSIIGWSLGAGKVNGYNYQKSYIFFKNVLDPLRPVFYLPAEESWNNDKLK